MGLYRRRPDRRNATERGLDAKLIIAFFALVAMPILLLTRSYLGKGQRLFDFAAGAALLYGGYVALFLAVPASFFLAARIARKLRRKPLSEEDVEQARLIRRLQDGPH
jgi:hypothetical protein